MAAWCGTGQIAELVLSGDKLDGKRESTRPGQWAREQLGFYLGPARFLRDDAGKEMDTAATMSCGQGQQHGVGLVTVRRWKEGGLDSARRRDAVVVVIW
ncbi:hypothetical protein M0R45_000179 [Rubus argutus]|uniref:Uncharacterized protein n=1 Tax=Rubus argutus TaxID=59490 RepID=A0AAW1VRT1_RUBAR